LLRFLELEGVWFYKPGIFPFQEDELNITEYRGLGERAIFCTLEWGRPRVLFQLSSKGFGVFGPIQDGFYRSVVACFRYLQHEHGLYHVLYTTATLCADAYKAALVSMASQPTLALEIANQVFEKRKEP
jgi:hypothetical protein